VYQNYLAYEKEGYWERIFMYGQKKNCSLTWFSLSARRVIWCFLLMLIMSLTVAACGEVSIPNYSQNVTVTPAYEEETLSPITPQPTVAAKLTVIPSVGDWRSRWLRGIPCRPPCFEGITPGITKAEEVVKILQQSPVIAATREYPKSGEIESVTWYWVEGFRSLEEPDGRGGMVSFDSKTSLVKEIDTQLGEIKLSDVIRAYGEPSHIVVFKDTNYDDVSKYFYYLRIVYLPQGFYLKGIGLDKPDITPDMLLRSPDFIVPTIETFNQSISGAKEHTIPWQGFKSFDEYCQIKSCGM
jgi:hypothetical protein